MFNKNNNYTDYNNTERIVYVVVGGTICCCFEQSYIPLFVFGGVLLWSLHEIIMILDKYKDIYDMKFIEKEKIDYFNKK